MLMLEKNLIQIAGVQDINEALMLQQCGVKYLGFPLRIDINKEDISEDEAGDIINFLSASTNAVIITYINDPDEIADLCNSLSVSIVQLHGDIDPYKLKELKHISPDLTVIKSLVPGYHDISSIEHMIGEQYEEVDAFITDTYDPSTKARGATGKTHDWGISGNIVKHSSRPVILAGGLNPDNVREAIIRVKPFGVDCHTGVEGKDGRKSAAKVRLFVSEAKKGFKQIGHN